jgi:16S rRNA (uracil1498-N3)-methyltransferase
MSAVLVPAGSLAVGSRIRLPADEAHHLRVRRVAPGQRVRLLDGAGVVGLGTAHEEDDGWAVSVESLATVPPPEELIVAAGAGDRERFAWLVEKATELGATRIIPVETERSMSVSGRVRPEHLERLQRRSLEALKQSGGAWAPRVAPPTSLEDAIEAGRDCTRWLASASDEHVPESFTRGPLAVLVGPEGGFTAHERDRALHAGWQPVRLAPAMLRFETAALAALALAAAARVRVGTVEES